MQKLNSPYVIEVYHFDDVKREYVMEYVDTTLDKYIKDNNGELELSERINIVRQILKAFQYIHSKGVLHRDVSTNNILIKFYDGINVVEISDFGLVKTPGSILTDPYTEIKGYFNDPKLEMIGFTNYEFRHETYALTRIVYFVMTGRVTLGNYLNEEFKAFITRGISDNIDERFISVDQMQESFTKVVKSLK